MASTRHSTCRQSDAPEPDSISGLGGALQLGGAWIDELDRLATLNDKQFVDFVLQVVYCRRRDGRYCEVQRRDGPGDKGRDIVAWIDSKGCLPRRCDIYQCKAFDHPLRPDEVWVELGKLCFYTCTERCEEDRYAVPEHYYLAAPKGVGNDLQDLIDKPDVLRSKLLQKWDSKCSRKLSPLSGGLRKHIEAFDFGRVEALPPRRMIDEHTKHPCHRDVFGLRLVPRRPPEKPPADIPAKEARYVQQMHEAFADHLRVEDPHPGVLLREPRLRATFDQARLCFYWVESLEQFARDNSLGEGPLADLMDEVYHGILATVSRCHPDGYERMLQTLDRAGVLDLAGNILHRLGEVKQKDRIGVCHHLANEDRIQWVTK